MSFVSIAYRAGLPSLEDPLRNAWLLLLKTEAHKAAMPYTNQATSPAKERLIKTFEDGQKRTSAQAAHDAKCSESSANRFCYQSVLDGTLTRARPEGGGPYRYWREDA